MTRRKPRRYDSPGDGRGFLTASELRRADRDEQKEVMSIWFHQNYEDPVECCPYESAEGGYQFIHGGPYDPKEELEEEFDGVVRPEVIEELADELSDQASEWTGRDRGPDLDDYFFASLARSKGCRDEFERSMKDIETLLEVAIDGDPQQCLLRLLYVNVITALEAYLSDFFSSAITRHDELRRKFVETNPEFKEKKVSVSEIFTVWEGMHEMVNKYLVDFSWHDFRRVIPMFKSTLGVLLNDDMDGLFKAVLVRHDLVHRNGKKKDGGEHHLQTEDVEKLISMAGSLVGEIERQWEGLNPGASKTGNREADVAF